MQICSNIDYIPYNFLPEFPLVEAGVNLYYSPPSELSRLHRHNCFEIGYCYQGSGVFLVDHHMVSFRRGDCSIIFPGQAHIASSNKMDPSYWRFVMVDMEAVLHIFQNTIDVKKSDLEGKLMNICHIIQPLEYPQLCMLIQMIVEQLAEKRTSYKCTVKGLSIALVSQIKSIGIFNHDIQEVAQYDTIAPALNYISNHYTEKISVMELAEQCNMSESTFRRNFRKIIGVAPMEFVYEARIKVATQLLQEGSYSINEIALMVGYETLSSFNRHFKKIKGVSPSQCK